MRYSHINPDSAEKYSIPSGEEIIFLATAESTEGKLSIFDSILPKGHAAPNHFHDIDDEIFYVISGEVEFVVEEESFIAKTGHLVIAGPKVRRSFKALEDSRLLVINAPGGPSEAFLRDVAKVSKKGKPTKEDAHRFKDLYGINV